MAAGRPVMNDVRVLGISISYKIGRRQAQTLGYPLPFRWLCKDQLFTKLNFCRPVIYTIIPRAQMYGFI